MDAKRKAEMQRLFAGWERANGREMPLKLRKCYLDVIEWTDKYQDIPQQRFEVVISVLFSMMSDGGFTRSQARETLESCLDRWPWKPE